MAEKENSPDVDVVKDVATEVGDSELAANIW